MLMDLGAEMARLAPDLPLRGVANDDAVHKEDVIEIIRVIGQGAQVLAEREGKADLKKFANDVQTVTAQTGDADVKDRLTALEGGLKAANLLAPPRQPPAGSTATGGTDVAVTGSPVAAPANARPTAAPATPPAPARK